LTSRKVVGALVAWVIGAWLIRMMGRVFGRALASRRVDPTLSSYLGTSLRVVLKILLVIAILGIFDVETTSFAAFFAALGIAIGMAWSGLLSNFAAGVFMVILRPIKVGDFVHAGGVTGTVKEIGLFVTAIDTMDNVHTIIGNSKIFGDNMVNYSHNEDRRVDCRAQLAHGVDYKQAIKILRDRLPGLAHVSKTMAPVVEIVEFNLAGPVLCVRPYTNTSTYWDVFFATNALIKDAFTEAGFATPETHHQVLTKAA